MGGESIGLGCNLPVSERRGCVPQLLAAARLRRRWRLTSSPKSRFTASWALASGHPRTARGRDARGVRRGRYSRQLPRRCRDRRARAMSSGQARRRSRPRRSSPRSTH